jgi:GntR family transcriptional regulator/MocR family aminotransferase
MRRIPAAFFPPMQLDPRRSTPIYRQLYSWFRAAILDGLIRPGQQIPSTRSLSAELRIPRIPVLSAYEQLHTEGYLETYRGAGTCVARSIVDNPNGPT